MPKNIATLVFGKKKFKLFSLLKKVVGKWNNYYLIFTLPITDMTPNIILRPNNKNHLNFVVKTFRSA